MMPKVMEVVAENVARYQNAHGFGMTMHMKVSPDPNPGPDPTTNPHVFALSVHVKAGPIPNPNPNPMHPKATFVTGPMAWTRAVNIVRAQQQERGGSQRQQGRGDNQRQQAAPLREYPADFGGRARYS